MDWEGAWKVGVKPKSRWDVGRTEIMLDELLDKRMVVPPVPGESEALVPGCGRGYSLVSLAKAGFKATGMDIAPTGVAQANAYLETVEKKETLPAQVLLQDFFDLPESEYKHRYDLVFDSTFLCAIEPELRRKWADQMKFLLKPGGILVSNVFPNKPVGEKEISMKDDPGLGPPYLLSTTIVKELLLPLGFTVIFQLDAPQEKRSRDPGPSPYPREVWMILQSSSSSL